MGTGIGDMTFSRRNVLALMGAGPLASLVPGLALAQERQFRHGSSLIGDVKYAPDFKLFDYVNADAPKGGRVRVGTLGSFDSLNPHSTKGDAINAGVNETLMTASLDEPSAEYGLIAESLWYPEDYSKAVFKLRPEARFHDGQPITVEDVIFSLEEQKKHNTNIAAYYKDVVKVEKTGNHEVTFSFGSGNRELPQILGQLEILPKHWWTANDANGKPRDLGASTLEPPLGSGPYMVSSVKPGLSITTKRFEAYWGKHLPINRGKHNFDEVEIQFYQDRAVILEAFKGGQFDIQLETSSKQWATGYDVPAVKEGRIIKEQIPRKGVSGMQCWVVNLRRPLFQDKRVRMALDLAFDFEWSNANLFYGLYTRCRSYYGNSELEAKGLPSPEELKLLEPLRGTIPDEVFTTEYVSYNNATPQDRRKNLRQAQALLAQAGWSPVTDGSRQVLKNAEGRTFKFEITLDGPAFERIALPYKEQLALLGIDVTVRTIDDAQYKRVKEQFDYDMISSIFPQSLSPGNEQRDFFGSEFANKPQTRNEAGIADPAIDTLVNAVITAPNRDALIIACRALDRVLIWNRFVIPCWFKAEDWIAYWKRVKHPANMPGYALGYPTIWWFDAEADAALKKT